MEANITLDSPVPYDLNVLLSNLKSKDQEMVAGSRAGTENKELIMVN